MFRIGPFKGIENECLINKFFESLYIYLASLLISRFHYFVPYTYFFDPTNAFMSIVVPYGTVRQMENEISVNEFFE